MPEYRQTGGERTKSDTVELRYYRSTVYNIVVKSVVGSKVFSIEIFFSIIAMLG